MPSSLAGVVLLLAALSPGYWWLLVHERRRPRRHRSNLVELVELLTVGSLASIAACVAVLLIPGWVDRMALRADGVDYLVTHPVAGATALAAVLVSSGALTASLALLLTQGSQTSIQAGSTLSTALAGVKGRVLFVSLFLHDGRQVKGPLRSYVDGEAPSQASFHLYPPIEMTAPGDGTFVRLTAQGLVISLDEVAFFTTDYVDLPSAHLHAPKLVKQSAEEQQGSEWPSWVAAAMSAAFGAGVPFTVQPGGQWWPDMAHASSIALIVLAGFLLTPEVLKAIGQDRRTLRFEIRIIGAAIGVAAAALVVAVIIGVTNSGGIPSVLQQMTFAFLSATVVGSLAFFGLSDRAENRRMRIPLAFLLVVVGSALEFTTLF